MNEWNKIGELLPPLNTEIQVLVLNNTRQSAFLDTKYLGISKEGEPRYLNIDNKLKVIEWKLKI